jgi:hypothetical protein
VSRLQGVSVVDDFKTMLTLMMMEAQNEPDWKFDHNTTLLAVVGNHLASLLSSVQVLTNRFEQMENVNPIAIMMNITQVLEFITENMENNLKDG